MHVEPEPPTYVTNQDAIMWRNKKWVNADAYEAMVAQRDRLKLRLAACN